MKQVLASQNSYSVWRTSRLINMFSNPLGFLFMFCLRPKIYFSSDGRFQLGRPGHSFLPRSLPHMLMETGRVTRSEWSCPSLVFVSHGSLNCWTGYQSSILLFFSLPGFGFDDVLPNYVPARSSAGKIGTSGEKNKVLRDHYLRLGFINGFLFFFLVLAAQTWESSVLVLISF